MLKIGTAQIDITPPLPYPRGGGVNVDRVADTFLDPMYANALVLQTAENTLMIISCDITNFRDDLANELRTQIAQDTGISRANIFLSATHNHQTPRFATTWPEPWKKPRDPENREYVTGKILEVAQAANNNLRPARMGYNSGKAGGFSFNRRYIMSDGRSKMHPGQGDNPDRLMAEGPGDDSVHVFWFEDEEGQLLAAMVQFTAHAIVMNGTSYASADYPGVIRETMQQVFGKDVCVAFLQGAAGNVCPFDVSNKGHGRGPVWRKRIGRTIAGEAIRLISLRPAWMDNPRLDVCNETLQLPYRDLSPELVTQATAQWASFSEADKVDASRGWEVLSAYSIVELNRRREENPLIPAEIAAIRLGDTILATFPAEMFVEYGLEMREKVAQKYHLPFVVMGYTNGTLSYVPTPVALALGGYEAGPLLSSKLAEDAGQTLVEHSLGLVERVLSD